MENKNTLLGILLLLVGFLMCVITFKTVYSNNLYNNLYAPFIYILGIILIICGLYLLIKEKLKINKFLRPTKPKVILSLVVFIILSGIFLRLWPSPILTCQAIGCEPIFRSSRVLARFSFLFLILSYLLSSVIVRLSKIINKR